MATKVEEGLTEAVSQGVHSNLGWRTIISRHELKGWGLAFSQSFTQEFSAFSYIIDDGLRGGMWWGLYQSEWTSICCTNKRFQKLSGWKQPKFISHSCHMSIRRQWGLCSTSPHFGARDNRSATTLNHASYHCRWKENSWRVSCWYLNVLAQKYHKSLLLRSHWLELVTWPNQPSGYCFMTTVPSCYSRKGW